MNYLLACTASGAHRDAKARGWNLINRNGTTMAIDDHGDPVCLVSSAERLQGVTRGAKVYLGNGWLFAHGVKGTAGAETLAILRGRHAELIDLRR